MTALVQAGENSGRRPGARRLPIVVRQGSAAHRTMIVVPWVLGALALVYVPFAHEVGFAPGTIDQPFRIRQINEVIAFAVAILGLDLVIGFSGQLSLGQSAFVGLGAFTSMILVADHGWSIFATLPVIAVLCFAVGLLIGFPTSRLRGPYLAVVTLAMAYVFPALVLRYDWLTGGPNGKRPDRGVGELHPPSWMPVADAGRLARPLWTYCILVVMAVLLFLLARNLVRSRPGRALMAVRDDPTGATSSGVDVTLYKAMAFAMSALYGGLAGVMLMMNRPFASDVQFGTRMAIFLVVGLVVGGVGTVGGAIPAAVVYFFVPYYIAEWTLDQRGIPPGLRQLTQPFFDWVRPAGATISGLVFGVLLLVLLRWMPGGLVTATRRLRSRVVRIEPAPAWIADVAPVRSATDRAHLPARGSPGPAHRP